MRIGIIFATVMAASATHTAQAGWLYTNWGMTVDEVVSASDGKATAAEDSMTDKSKERFAAALKAPHEAAGQMFQVMFLFEKPSARLAEIQLSPEGRDCGQIRTLLTRKYGEPTSRAETDISVETSWIETDTKVLFTEFPVLRRCQISYYPARADEAIGL